MTRLIIALFSVLFGLFSGLFGALQVIGQISQSVWDGVTKPSNPFLQIFPNQDTPLVPVLGYPSKVGGI